MTVLQIGKGAYKRAYGKMPQVRLENRFIEANPTNLQEHVALLSRPGNKVMANIGSGPLRALYMHTGTFDDDLFVVSGTALWRYALDGTKTQISGTVLDNGNAQMTIVAGTGYEHLWITDGTLLQYYDGVTAASGTLTLTPGAIADDIVIIDLVHYQFAADPTSDPSADGSLSNPWQVNVGVDDETSLGNLLKALNASGIAGTDYSTSLALHPTVKGVSSTATTMVAEARTRGTGGDSITTTVTLTGGDDGLAWGATTLENGGNHALHGAEIPSGAGATALDSLVGFVVVATAQEDRFYYVRPAELTVQSLDFATAERQADKIIDVVTVGGQVWLLGQTTTEVWYPTGDTNTPFRPVQGRTFSRGSLQGTARRVGDAVLLVGDDDVVYRVAGSPVPVSTNAISERIRESRRLIAENGP